MDTRSDPAIVIYDDPYGRGRFAWRGEPDAAWKLALTMRRYRPTILLCGTNLAIDLW